MKEYANNLEKFGFGSLKTLKNIDSDDINNYLPEMLPGHKKALLEETKKLITPVKVHNETDSSTVADAKCNNRQEQLDFGTNISTNGQNGNNNNSSGNISVFVNTTEREVQKSSLSKKPRVENSDDNPSVPKTMTNKEEELVIKLSKVEAQIEAKTEEIKCFMIPVETLPPLGNIASVCGNCHRKGHRAEGNKGKKDCRLDKCKSFFICGQKIRHPEYSKQLAQKKKELSNLQETLKNVTDELDMLRNFVEKTSETNFMLDVKRRLRITDPQKYRDVAVLLRDTRTLKVAYKGKIPPSDQNDREQFPRLLKQTRNKIKRDTGDFNLSDSDDSETIVISRTSVLAQKQTQLLKKNQPMLNALKRSKTKPLQILINFYSRPQHRNVICLKTQCLRLSNCLLPRINQTSVITNGFLSRNPFPIHIQCFLIRETLFLLHKTTSQAITCSSSLPQKYRIL